MPVTYLLPGSIVTHSTLHQIGQVSGGAVPWLIPERLGGPSSGPEPLIFKFHSSLPNKELLPEVWLIFRKVEWGRGCFRFQECAQALYVEKSKIPVIPNALWKGALAPGGYDRGVRPLYLRRTTESAQAGTAGAQDLAMWLAGLLSQVPLLPPTSSPTTSRQCAVKCNVALISGASPASVTSFSSISAVFFFLWTLLLHVYPCWSSLHVTKQKGATDFGAVC